MLRFPVQVRYSDYDTKGHVNNAVYFTYFESARMQAWLTHIAPSGAVTGADASDPPIIVAEARAKYVSQARIGDPLAIEIGVREVRTKGFSFFYRIVDARDDRLVAEGETVQVHYDYESRRTTPIPPALRAALESM